MFSLSILFLLLLASIEVQATHVNGGEFSYTHISGLTYEIRFHFYTDLSSPADRPDLIFNFGDGNSDTVPRSLIIDHPGNNICGDGIRYAEYGVQHTYPSSGTFLITMDDQNRNGGIINIPNSIAQSFCVSATLIIDPVAGNNNSVRFDNPQYNTIQSGWTFEHSLDAFDPDGDSLSFELQGPQGINCQPIAGYQFPGPDFTFDGQTGQWQWTASLIGEYTIAIKATEWRNGQMIGEVTRDMTICVIPMVGIEETAAPLFTISPSLTNGPIDITDPSSEGLSIEVLDAHGKIVLRTRTDQGGNRIDLGHLASGTYVVRGQRPNGEFHTVRVLKR